MKNTALVAICVSLFFFCASAGEKEGIEFYNCFHEDFHYSEADGVNVCFCGNYGALYDVYSSVESSIPSSSLTNRVVFSEIQRFIDFNGDFFRCDTKCNMNDAFITGFWSYQKNHYGTWLADNLEPNWNKSETDIKAAWDKVQKLSLQIVQGLSTDHCTLGKNMGEVIKAYTYWQGKGSIFTSQ